MQKHIEKGMYTVAIGETHFRNFLNDIAAHNDFIGKIHNGPMAYINPFFEETFKGGECSLTAVLPQTV